MDIKEYISSGILETYVLEGLSKEEMLEVEIMASKHPEIREEIASIREALDNYASAHSIAPPPSLKKRILSAIDGNLNNAEEPKIIKLKKKAAFAQYLAAASICGMLLTAGFGVYYYAKWKDAEEKIITLNNEKAVIANQVNIKNSALEKSESLLAIIQDTSTSTVEMKGLDIAPQANAKVYWNKNSHEVYLKVENLPDPPEDKQYQLWALKDGAPVDAGVFNVETAIQKMRSIDGAQAFAVTLEKRGGNPTPTLDAMYLIGNI